MQWREKLAGASIHCVADGPRGTIWRDLLTQNRSPRPGGRVWAIHEALSGASAGERLFLWGAQGVDCGGAFAPALMIRVATYLLQEEL